MRTEVIKADSIDAAAERIMDELKEDDATTARSISSRNNVIYFDGWDGLGASAVLRAVAQRLTVASSEAPAGLQFDQIIHIDCAKWESRRALQREIAEQLKLPAHVMDMFDTQDAEDDYNGVAKESRAEIPQIVREMYGHVTKVLLIFHNGSDEEIDMASFCGFPLSGYSTNKMLWTFQGRFRMCPRIKVDRAFNKSTAQGAATDVFLSAVTERESQVSYLVLQEAADLVAAVAAGKNNNGHGVVGSGGIIQIQLQQGHIGSDEDDDAPWRAADNLQREMQLDVEYWRHNLESLPSCLVRCGDRIASMPYWTSPPYEVLLSPLGDMFQQFDKLGVLKLSRCTFSLLSVSPPFHSCNNLRVLWLDHCKDQVIFMDGAPEKIMEEDVRQLFQRLWVLDVCYSRCDRILSAQMIALMTQLRELNVVGAHDWDISQLQQRLPNIRRLRVTKSTVRCSGHSGQDLFQGMNKMELLDFSGNRTMQGVTEFFKISTSNNCLETVIIVDGCFGLQKFSFRGYAKLKNLLLRGLFEDLRTLDLSGTAVKTLDLSAVTARRLDEVILDNCDKLCAILWPAQDKRNMDLAKVHIDTTQLASTSKSGEEKMKAGSTAATGTSSSWPMVLVNGAQLPSEFNWYISIKDTRLLRSFVPSFKNYFTSHKVHLEISSPSCYPTINVSSSENEGIKHEARQEPQGVLSNRRQQQQPQYKHNTSMYYADVASTIVGDRLLQGGEGNDNDAPTITRTRPCPPPAQRLDSSHCYLYTQDQWMKTKATMDGGAIATIPSFICDNTSILHVHDSLYNTSIPGSAQWIYLQWCRVERCPRLDFIFTAPQLGGESIVVMCCYLRTFWASKLLRTCFMWDMSKLPLSQIHIESFEHLTLLHLDFCPRLIHVLPFSASVFHIRLLETIEIVWCGDLRVVFPLLDTNTESHQKQQQEKPPEAIITTMDFPDLKRIHLHELPMLESICGGGRVYAPKLESVKIRGCWRLRHLPAVRSNRSSDKVECDCEKEWWERLEWNGLDGKHDPCLYKPIHPRYYKKKLLRGSVLI